VRVSRPGRLGAGRVSIRFLRVSVGLIVSALLFWLAYDHAGGEEVWQIFRTRRLHVEILIGAAVVDTVVLVLRSVKWRLILLPVKRVRLTNTFSASAIGVMTNNLLPLRIDEVVRAYILGRRERVPAPVVLGTVAVERSADIAVVVMTVIAATVLMPVPAGWAAVAPYVWTALGVGAGVMLASAFAGARIAGWIRRLGERGGRAVFGRAATACEGFARAVRAFPRDWRLPVVVGLTLTEMACSVVVAWLTAATLGVMLPAQALVVVVLGGYLSFAIPSSPGSVGVYESINCVALTGLYGVPAAEAGAYVVLLHAMLIAPSSLIGLACLWRERVGFGRLVREGTREKPVVEGVEA